MSQTILIKKSGTATNVPVSLAFGELAINYADSKLFFKNLAGSIVALNDWATIFNKPTTLSGYGITDAVNTSQLGTASGIATLDGSGKLTTSQIPASLVGAVVYQGTWNASTNVPTLVSSTGTKGFYYKVSTAGATSVDGISSWYAGDTIIFNGTTWDKIDGIANEVISVAGRSGAIVLTSADVGLGNVTNVAQLAATQTLAVTGDATASATALSTGTIALTLAAGSVTLAKMASMATASLIYRKTAGTGAPEVNTLATLKTDLGLTGTNSGDQTITLTGDATGSGTGSFAVSLAATGVTAGTYTNSATQHSSFTVDAKGRVTAVGAAVTIAPAWSSITGTPTTVAGYGITDALTTSSTIDGGSF